MILAPHALVGAAIAVIFRRHPLIAVVAAFLSHFVLDAIPHRVYKLNSIKEDSSQLLGATFNPKGLVKDFLKTGVDFGVGLAIALVISDVFFPKYFWLSFFGAAAGVLPDFLQLMYYFFPNSPLSYFQWFHKKIHMKEHSDGNSEFLHNVSYQILFSLVVILITIFIGPLF